MPEIYTVIDLETTGLDHETDHITEIAAIRTDGTRVIGRFHTFVSLPNGVKVPPEITELTGIKTEDLDGASTEWDALLALEAFTYGTTVVAHNVPFDLAFVSRVFTPERFVCTRALSKLVEPKESASLKDVCARHGIKLNGQHRAMNDVEATVKVLGKLREIAEINGISYRNVVIDSDERPLRYVPNNAIVRTINKEAV
ncbi:PolC-type DNA polymerase III [Paenibacillus alvei]|uniref:3'-5' exonuclease n=1 Tax=Paenibacillus alvei TaxID=44250 RepID=UPI0018CF4D3E|nr:3'-5' exonuclease [Paenibacillus alvei]MBG9736460.1 DNA polymerase III [Paenibacillus alvei]MBG9736490.1 DNA polymerase III [Paenibacillus alvei]MBG9736510.1 DNA polymerase III [Paenibacillus alvei]MBG9736601.1 DNA polymerase III [Paenibacillus alvei]MBG9745585.1 DNA polymerase III [Paenibacillus alvei]